MFSPQARIVNALVSYVEYPQKMVCSKKPSILYPHPGDLLPVWQGVVCAAVLGGVTIAALRLLWRAPYFAFGWFWYLATLVPVIGLVQVGVQVSYWKNSATLKTHPDDAESHNHLAMALTERGRFAQAEISCREALRIRPNYPPIFSSGPFG